MRVMLATLSVAFTLAGAMQLFAGENDPEIYFSNPTNTELTIKFVAPLDPTANNCDGRTACGQLYYLQQDTGLTTEPPHVCTEAEEDAGQLQDCVPAVTHVRLSDDHHALVLNLLPPLSIKSLHLVLRRLLAAQLLSKQSKPEQKLTTIDFTPTLYLDFNDKERKNLIYRGILLQGKVAPGSVLVTVIDGNKKKVPAQVKQVTAYPKEHPEGNFLWKVELVSPLPQGQALNVTVEGIENYRGQKISANEKIMLSSPKGRDDATFYFRGQQEFNELGHDQGSVDVKYGQSFPKLTQAQEWWFLLDAVMGTDTLKLAQTGSFSLGYRWWLGKEWAISAAPTFRTDKPFHNRDLGANVAFEGQPECLYHTIEYRKGLELDPAKKNNIHWGFWLKPKLTFETGEHIGSSSEEIKNTTFFRSVPSFNLLVERDKITLTVDAAVRILSKDELALGKTAVVRIDSGAKPYLRAELAYDLGSVAFSLVHENGSLPPAFQDTRQTTVGVTFKF